MTKWIISIYAYTIIIIINLIACQIYYIQTKGKVAITIFIHSNILTYNVLVIM